jgi:hypothetical protein
MKNFIIPIVALASTIFLLSYMTVNNAYSLPVVDKQPHPKFSDFKPLGSSVKINKGTTKCYIIKSGKLVRVPCPDIVIIGKAIGDVKAQ